MITRKQIVNASALEAAMKDDNSRGISFHRGAKWAIGILQPEIERLEAVYSQAAAISVNRLTTEIEQMQAKNERLMEALQSLIELNECFPFPITSFVEREILHEAKQALKQ